MLPLLRSRRAAIRRAGLWPVFFMCCVGQMQTTVGRAATVEIAPRTVTLSDSEIRRILTERIDVLPAEVAALRQVSQNLVFHYRAGGDFEANGTAGILWLGRPDEPAAKAFVRPTAGVSRSADRTSRRVGRIQCARSR